MMKNYLKITIAALLLLVFATTAQAIKTWNASALTGGTAISLDAYPVASLSDGDRAFVAVSGTLYYYEFDTSASNAESSPDYIRPDDYSSAGVWVLQRWYTQDKNYNRNLLINSDFAVNQEGYAADGVASLASASYGHDMWRSLSGSTLIYTKESNGDITINSITRSTAGAGGLYQKNDELVGASGKTLTVSLEVVSLDAPMRLAVEAETLTISTPGVYTITYVSGGVGSLQIDHTFAGAATHTPNFRFKNLKIEYGSTATEYEIPEPRAEEARCYYYYYRLEATSQLTHYSALTGFWYQQVPVTMKSGATASEVGTITFNGTTSHNLDSISAVSVQSRYVTLVMSSDTNPAASTVSIMTGIAGEYIELDARY